MSASTCKTKGCIQGVLILFILLIFSVNPASALPLTSTSVVHGDDWASFKVGTSTKSWFTEYYLNSNELGESDAFCVENADVNSYLSYELLPVPSDSTNLQTAMLVAGNYFYDSSNTWSKTATQIAIWEIMFETDENYSTSSGNFQFLGYAYLPDFNSSYAQTYSSLLNEVNTILSAIAGLTPYGPVSLAHSPAGHPISEIEASQDYLVAAPVPEPASMLLLGTGLIGLAGLSRRKLFPKI